MKRIAVLLALVLCLSACSAAAQTPPCPPESILYLGGAHILERFTVSGGPGDGVDGTSIVIQVPPVYEKEGFHAMCVGYHEDGSQETIFTEEDLTPESYYVIEKETYQKFQRLSLCLDYTWYGTLMSMRIVELLTGEEHSSVATEFDVIEQPLPSEPTVPTSPAVLDFSEYEALLSFSAQPNWLARALGCLFESPAEVDLNYLFYLGVDYPGSWGEISDESRRKLIDEGFWEEMDIQIMPADILGEALRECFGIGLEDVTIPEEWCYIEAEDAWCSNHNDAYFPGVPNITAVEDAGQYITIHYTIEGFWDYQNEEILDTAPLILSMIRNDDGTIHAISNLLDS